MSTKLTAVGTGEAIAIKLEVDEHDPLALYTVCEQVFGEEHCVVVSSVESVHDKVTECEL